MTCSEGGEDTWYVLVCACVAAPEGDTTEYLCISYIIPGSRKKDQTS